MPREHHGDIAGVDYTVEWLPNTQELTLTLMTHLMPAVRMTRQGKWSGRAKEYVDTNNGIRDTVLLLLRKHDLLSQGEDGEWLPLFDKSVKLWLRGGVHCKSARGDVSNYLKAAEDALQGALYDNDIQIQRVEFEKVQHKNREGFWVELRPTPETSRKSRRY